MMIGVTEKDLRRTFEELAQRNRAWLSELWCKLHKKGFEVPAYDQCIKLCHGVADRRGGERLADLDPTELFVISNVIQGLGWLTQLAYIKETL